MYCFVMQALQNPPLQYVAAPYKYLYTAQEIYRGGAQCFYVEIYEKNMDLRFNI
jgi:hypothetical protein